jgi:hypothetical protein
VGVALTRAQAEVFARWSRFSQRGIRGVMLLEWVILFYHTRLLSVALLDDGRKLGKKIQHCIRRSQACIVDLDCIWKSTCGSNGDLKAIHDSPQGSSPNIYCNDHTDTTLTRSITLPQSPFQMTKCFALSHYYNSLQTHHKRKQTQQSTPTTLPQPSSFTKAYFH